MRHFALLLVMLMTGAPGCLEQRCYEEADCSAPKICGSLGLCIFECVRKSDCPTGFLCRDHVCVPNPTGPITCPENMVAVEDTFCIDSYEASRPDATAENVGIDNTVAVSAAGVLPWQVASNSAAEEACQAAGKRLCDPEEWQLACSGPDGWVYAYGNQYEPETCNGIDAFGRDNYHLMPTGSFQQCTNEWGAYDLNGNLWEHVANGSDQTVRGGAFNCGDSARFHRCDYVPGSWAPVARGFRCCLSP
jgi:formylglycine-generating enzyme